MHGGQPRPAGSGGNLSQSETIGIKKPTIRTSSSTIGEPEGVRRVEGDRRERNEIFLSRGQRVACSITLRNKILSYAKGCDILTERSPITTTTNLRVAERPSHTT